MQTSTLKRRLSVSEFKQYYPLKVVCVVKSLEDAKQESLTKIKVFCNEKLIMYETRIYDSYKYRHDRDEIAQLPAFHLYVSNSHEGTFYPNGRPIQIIGDHLAHYIKKQQAKWDRHHQWNAFWKRLLARIWAIGHRETRLERAEREQRQDEEKRERRVSDLRSRSMSFADWD